MKTRESGMPEESMWAGFFDPPAVLARLGLTAEARDAADLGCGYGTFTLPAARLVPGTVWALDIEAEMITATAAKAKDAGLNNVRAIVRDFVAGGTGLPDGAVGFAMLFNLLHCEAPVELLAEARRILRPGGRLAIMHWNYDPATPRGPSMEIRPRPEQCRAWAVGAGLEPEAPGVIDLPPYHWGLVLVRPLA